MSIHFVGFRSAEEYCAAVKIWGRPDFIHLHHDHRMYGDTGYPIDPNEEVVILSLIHISEPTRPY